MIYEIWIMIYGFLMYGCIIYRWMIYDVSHTNINFFLIKFNSTSVWYHTLYDIIQNFILTKKDEELKIFFSYRTKLCDYDSTTEIMAIYTKLQNRLMKLMCLTKSTSLQNDKLIPFPKRERRVESKYTYTLEIWFKILCSEFFMQ